jgi:hypothetical protein
MGFCWGSIGVAAVKGTLSPDIRWSVVGFDLEDAPEPDLLCGMLEDGGTAGADRTGSVEFIVRGVATLSMMCLSLRGVLDWVLGDMSGAGPLFLSSMLESHPLHVPRCF